MDPIREYHSKRVSAEQAVKVVKSGDWVDYNFGLAQPIVLDQALAARKEELLDVKVRGGMMLNPLKIVEGDPLREHFCYNSWHFSGPERKLHDRGLCNYIPMIYRHMPLFYRKSLDVDVAMFSVTPMDKNGYFGFSLTNSASSAICELAKIIILEVNDKFPVVACGRENFIHISDVDFVVESGNPTLPIIKPSSAGEVEQKIAELVMKEIEDGSTIQLGVGALPNAVGNLIAESDLKDLGLHTEMLVDAYMTMAKRGKMTNQYKTIDKGKGVWTFCAGSQELYDWVDGNTALASCPSDYVNNPYVMANNDKLVTINNCIEVDLLGQVNAETSGIRQISGTGGQLDFLTGGYMSKGGKSFICFSSTFTNKKTGVVKSRIIPGFSENTVVTNSRTQAHYFVTEWGIADLAGRTTWERAERIINIAHPDFREGLIKDAERLKIWRKTNKI